MSKATSAPSPSSPAVKLDIVDEEDDINVQVLDLDFPKLDILDSDEENDESFDNAVKRIQQQQLVKNFALRDGKASNTIRELKDMEMKDILSTSPTLNEHETFLEASVESKPEAVEDFLRNFLVAKNMFSTLEAFQNEWYEMQQKGTNATEQTPVPEVYHQNSILEAQLKQVRLEARAFKQLAENTQGYYNQVRKEKDFLKLQYQRLLQEKSKLQSENQQQKQTMHHSKATQEELQIKLNQMIKINTLLKLEKEKGCQRKGIEKVNEREKEKASDKCKNTVQQIEKDKRNEPVNSSEKVVFLKLGDGPPIFSSEKKKKSCIHQLPSENRRNPYFDTTYIPLSITRMFSLREVLSIKAHSLPVSNLAFHPRKMIFASASDDKSWKLWNFPSGELLMCGEGHENWISGLDFHPQGTHLATSSGDLSIKLWDFAQHQPILTMKDHLRPVWSCLFHDTGDFLLSCSLDATAKLWDLSTGRCKQTFRAHADSVNSIAWQHYTNTFYTCSGDKSILSWDARMNHPAQQFRGHASAINCITCSLNNESLVSGDAEGILKLWDPRTTHELLSINFGPTPINKLALDPAISTIAAASQDGSCKLFSIKEKIKKEFTAHNNAVQACLFSPMQSEYLITCSSDHTIKLWN